VGAVACGVANMIVAADNESVLGEESQSSLAPHKPPKVESSTRRAKLPPYKIIPAAKASELTPALETGRQADSNWFRSNGNNSNTRYSALSQINKANVDRLQAAWIYHSGDGKGNIQANPVIVDGVIYAPTVGKNIVAIDGDIGKELWRFHPSPRASAIAFYDPQKGAVTELQPDDPATRGMIQVGYGPAQRGLTYWAGDPEHAPRLYFMANGFLIALNPKTGQLVESFGDHGEVGSSKEAGKSSFLGAVAPAIYRNIIIAPNQNIIDAFDVVSGARLWQFDTLRYPVMDPNEDNGGNVWGGVALDTERGIVYVATGDPHPDQLVGVDRLGDDCCSSSLIALDVLTGHQLWVFQEVKHNLWDLDVPAPPNLVTVTHNGRRVDAVAQVTKLGNTLLLDRLTGKPLFPFRLRRAPVSRVPGEETWPYQPDVEWPQPFAKQRFSLDELSSISPQTHAFVLQKASGAAYGWFEPPAPDRSLIFFGVHGGAEWTGATVDSTTGWLYVSANELPWVASLEERTAEAARDTNQAPSAGQGIFHQRCAVCHGESRRGKGMVPSLLGLAHRQSEEQVIQLLKTGRNAMPPAALTGSEQHDLINFLFDLELPHSNGAVVRSESPPAIFRTSSLDRFLDAQGYPATKPPWGTLNAIDLNSGRLVWKVPLGEYEELTRLGIPKTGTENFGGAMVTAGGLVFCAGTRDLMIRAFDKDDGRELWKYKLPYGGYAPPATYEIHGRQFVVIAATSGGKLGGDMGDAYVAFALPPAKLQ
jgi:quinoprotein glucose dehydrogenase